MSEPTARDPELEALLGAYAVDAVDGEELARVEAYLARNPAARAEVDELRETAAALALAPDTGANEPAPPAIWDRIAATIAEEKQAPAAPVDELAARRGRRTATTTRVMAVVSIAAAIVVVVLGAQVLSLHHQLNDARNPGGRTVALAGPNGAELARVVLAADGSGRLVNEHLATLPANRTYQLWAMMGDKQHPSVISAGVLGNDVRRANFKVVGPLIGLAVTVEQAGGVAVTRQQPVASASIS
jgi:hypothetical protein